MVSALGSRTALVVAALSVCGSTTALSKRSGRGTRVPLLAPVPVDSPDYTPTDPAGNDLPPFDTFYYFDQLIDHEDPSLGTFEQRYYFTAQYYQKGGPIILSTPGEGNVDGYEGYLTNSTINGQYAQALNGATVVIEHRFFGLSNPYPDLTEKSLKFHNMEQAVADLVYFAETAVLPMNGGDSVKAPHQAPWILVGGSYSGALTGWTMYSKPGVFWAGHASSAVVEAIDDFWQFFEPIRTYMPSNCSADYARVVELVDNVFTFGSPSEKTALKNQLGMANITHLDDVAGTLRYPLWNWLSLQPTSGGAIFYDVCDAIEVKNNVSAPASGWGLAHALPALGYYLTSYLPDVCGGEVNDDCLGTYDKTLPYYTSTAIDNAVRSWEWFVCNFFSFSTDGAPESWPTIVSRLIKPSYERRQCNYFFPNTFPTITSAKPQTAAFNQKYGGWDASVQRLLYANGQRDAYRDATVSSTFHTRQSTPWQPILLGDSFHGTDLFTSENIDPTILKIQETAVAYMTKWHAEWHVTVGKGKRAFDDELIARMDEIIRQNGSPV